MRKNSLWKRGLASFLGISLLLSSLSGVTAAEDVILEECVLADVTDELQMAVETEAVSEDVTVAGIEVAAEDEDAGLDVVVKDEAAEEEIVLMEEEAAAAETEAAVAVTGITGVAASGDAGVSVAADGDEATVAVDVDVTYGQTEARSILALINALRTGEDAWYWNQDDTTKTTLTNLSELTYDYTLEKVAMLRAAEIAIYYSHTRANGTTCWTAYTEYGYVYAACAENIAAGQTSAEAVYTAWLEESENYSGQGHRRNMLSSSVTSVGIGHVYYNGYHYWVQEFGKAYSGGSTTSTTANDSTTTVAVGVLESAISSISLTASPTSYSLTVGATAELPALTIKMKLTNSWPSTLKPVSVAYEWTVASGTCVKISDGLLCATASGEATLLASVVSETVSVDVSVAAKESFQDSEEETEQSEEETEQSEKETEQSEEESEQPKEESERDSEQVEKLTLYTAEYNRLALPQDGTARLAVEAASPNTITYRWYCCCGDADEEDFTKISGEIGSSYTATNVGGWAKYLCIVSDEDDEYQVYFEIFDVSGELSLDKATNATISEAGACLYYSFTVSETQMYVLYSEGDCDTWGILYDSDWNKLAYNDDGGDEGNFWIRTTLTAGETYYLGVRLFSGNETGSFTVHVEEAVQKCPAVYELSVNQAQEVTVTSSSQKTCFKFTPTQTDIYTFSSSGGSDPDAVLYDSEMECIDEDEDSGAGCNFEISCWLEAGETYYLLVTCNLDEDSESFAVSVVLKEETCTHSFDAGVVTKAATCTTAGIKTYTCTVCQATKTESIAATGHTEVVDKAVAATTTTAGKTAGSHCSACQTVLTAQQTIPATVKAPTLTNTSKGITIKWKKAASASGYYVWRKSGSGSYTKIATIKKAATVSYTDTTVKSKNGTTYTYKITAYKGSQIGSGKAATTVRLTGATLSSAKNTAKKTATIKWKKATKVSGYEVEYSTSKSFAGSKTKRVSGASKTGVKLTGLKKGKTYYVRVRTYKTVKGTEYYSAWSAKKSVKISK